jgi:hypothetical protein
LVFSINSAWTGQVANIATTIAAENSGIHFDLGCFILGRLLVFGHGTGDFSNHFILQPRPPPAPEHSGGMTGIRLLILEVILDIAIRLMT